MVSSTLASLLSLVVVIGSCLQAVATSSATSTTGVPDTPTSCLSEFDACFEDSTCSECLSGWRADPSDSDCQERYPSVSFGDVCAELGASSCCSLGDDSSADSCATNTMFVEYWGCFMSESDCTIEDLPCYSASATPSPSLTPTASPQPTSAMPIASPSLSPVLVPSASPLSFPPTVTPHTMEHPTTAPVMGTEIPTVSPTSPLSNLTSERNMDFTASPTASPSAVEFLFPECVNQTNACLEDDVCQGCMLDSVISDLVGESSDEFSECEIGYLGNTTDAGLCEVAGAKYCCSDDLSGGDCVTNDLSTEYWGCVFESLLCSMEEITCMGGIGGSIRTDDDIYYTADDDMSAEEAGSNSATGRWRGPRIDIFALVLVGIAATAIPVLGSSVILV